jgi:hypothetical protein
MKRSIPQSVSRAIVVAVAVWNIWMFTLFVMQVPPRDLNRTVVWEKRFEPIREVLHSARYRMGDLGYVTARGLRGEPVSDAEFINRAELYYVVIPWNLIQNTVDAPYVIGDFTFNEPTPELPQGLVKVFDPGNGLILFRGRAAK